MLHWLSLSISCCLHFSAKSRTSLFFTAEKKNSIVYHACSLLHPLLPHARAGSTAQLSLTGLRETLVCVCLLRCSDLLSTGTISIFRERNEGPANTQRGAKKNIKIKMC